MEDVAKKTPSIAKQVELMWMGLRTVVELLIGYRGWITYPNHFAELLTMETLETSEGPSPAVVELNQQYVAVVETLRETSSASPRREPNLRVSAPLFIFGTSNPVG